jgi:preprotein translocase subunit YajC
VKKALLTVVGLSLLLGWVAAAKAADVDVLHGKIVSVDTDKGTLVVKPKAGDNVTVATDANTKVTLDGKDAKLADLKADMMVVVAPATGIAKTIAAHTPGHMGLHGTIVSVDADKGTLVVKPKEGDNVTVTTDANTKVRLDEKDAKLADLKAGMMVTVIPATGVAKYIIAKTPAAAP